MSPSQPPPFSDFEYVFDPALASLSPPLLPIPSSADLFSPSETTDLLGFAPYPIPQSARDLDTPGEIMSPILPEQSEIPSDISNARPSSSSSATSSSPSKQDSAGTKRKRASTASCQTGRAKVLLSTPQKRLNHIMSEQKRRNAIREGYAQLISLLAPAGAQAIDMPTRGRPKGSGSRGKGHSKGKSGVLFRAVEYCRWLEEGRDVLMDEVLRLEAAAGIVYPSP